jgi:hypothetical protein
MEIDYEQEAARGLSATPGGGQQLPDGGGVREGSPGRFGQVRGMDTGSPGGSGGPHGANGDYLQGSDRLISPADSGRRYRGSSVRLRGMAGAGGDSGRSQSGSADSRSPLAVMR